MFKPGAATSAKTAATAVRTPLINHVDIAPTSLGLCGIEVPSDMVGFDAEKECCHQRLSDWIATTDDVFPLPDIALDGLAT